jgi:hypothetical protein
MTREEMETLLEDFRVAHETMMATIENEIAINERHITIASVRIVSSVAAMVAFVISLLLSAINRSLAHDLTLVGYGGLGFSVLLLGFKDWMAHNWRWIPRWGNY